MYNQVGFYQRYLIWRIQQKKSLTPSNVYIFTIVLFLVFIKSNKDE